MVLRIHIQGVAHSVSCEGRGRTKGAAVFKRARGPVGAGLGLMTGFPHGDYLLCPGYGGGAGSWGTFSGKIEAP
jgi:hypothetical protein